MQTTDVFYSPLLVLPALVFVCLLHGALLNVFLLQRHAYRMCIKDSVGFIVSAFFISLMVNAVFIILFSFLQMHIRYVLHVLITLDFLLILLVFVFRSRLMGVAVSPLRINWAHMMFYVLAVLMFYMMMQSGGLLDSLADGWWHMSMVQRIVSEGSVFYENHHLTGRTADYYKIDYPFLWHAVLAIIHELSGMSLPLIWHAVAAFVVFVTLCSYFCMAKAFTYNAWASLLAVLFFCVVYGGINSYFRVMPWPGNVSYIGLYFGVSLFVMAMTSLFVHPAVPNADNHNQMSKNIGRFATIALLLIMLMVVMVLIHGVAAAIMALSMVFGVYGVALHVLYKRIHTLLLIWVIAAVLLLGFVGLGLALLLFPTYVLNALRSLGEISYYFYALLVLPFILAWLGGRKAQRNTRVYLVAVIITFFVSVVLASDWHHVLNLFKPEQLEVLNRLEKARSFFGQEMILPHWPHQVKAGLLFSGLCAIFCCLILLCVQQNIRQTYLSANAFFAVFVLISPEFFRLTETVIYSSSTYRVHVLIFAPVVFAMLVLTCCRLFSSKNQFGMG